MTEMIGDLDELLGLIHRSARQDELDIMARAQDRARQIREQARRQAEQSRSAILETARRDAAVRRRMLLAQAALETQRQKLIIREQLLDQVWAEAEQQLRELPSRPEYAAVLQQLAVLAAAAFRPESVILAADEAGHQLLTPERLEAWSATAQVQLLRAAQPAPIWGGLLASDSSGRRQVDASFATRLARARAVLREETAHILELL